FAAFLGSDAATGQVHAEEEVVASVTSQRAAVLSHAAQRSGQDGHARQEPLGEARLQAAATQWLYRQQTPLAELSDGALARKIGQSGSGKAQRTDRRRRRRRNRHSVTPYEGPGKTSLLSVPSCPQRSSVVSKTRCDAGRIMLHDGSSHAGVVDVAAGRGATGVDHRAR